MRLCSCALVACDTDVCELRVVGALGNAVAASLRVSAQQSVRAGELVVLAVQIGVFLELWSEAMGLGLVSEDNCWTRVSVVWQSERNAPAQLGPCSALLEDSAASSLDALFPLLSRHNSGDDMRERSPPPPHTRRTSRGASDTDTQNN